MFVYQVVGLLQNLFVYQVAGRLQDFRELVKEVVRSACRTALLEAGFTPDDYFYDGADSPGMYGKVDSVGCLSVNVIPLCTFRFIHVHLVGPTVR